MKIIFLDIDGVLNHEKWFESEELRNIPTTLDGKTRNLSRWFDPKAVYKLNKLVKATEASIVLSSSWRAGKTKQDIDEMFETVGIVADNIGKTPHKNPKYARRGTEIQYWMDYMHPQEPIESYVILDDDDDMLYSQRKNFVHIDHTVGLQMKDVNKAIKILKWT